MLKRHTLKPLILTILLWVGVVGPSEHSDLDAISLPTMHVVDIGTPPISSNYDLTNMDGFRRYAIDMNWYLIRTYNIVKLMNSQIADISIDLNNLPPICILVPFPELSQLPKLNIDDNDAIVNLEWSMSDHIKSLESSYRSQLSKISYHVTVQRSNCLY